MPDVEIIYIAGPITSVADYRENFARAEQCLSGSGKVILNPALLPEGMPYESYMPICDAMEDVAGTIYFLRGWEHSTGARREFDRATRDGKKICFER